MSPTDYPAGQRAQQQVLGGNAFTATSAFADVGGAMPGLNQAIAPSQGELVRIYEKLAQYHSRICDNRDKLINLNERLGVRHIPQSGDVSKPSQPPQAEGMLPAIDSFLDLIDEALGNLDYQVQRTLQL